MFDVAHPSESFDLFRWDLRLVVIVVGGGIDVRLVQEVTAGPETSAEVQRLLDEQRLEAGGGEVPPAQEPGRPCPDDNNVALDEPVEFLEVLPGDLPGDVALPQGSRPFILVCHDEPGPTDRFPAPPS